MPPLLCKKWLQEQSEVELRMRQTCLARQEPWTHFQDHLELVADLARHLGGLEIVQRDLSAQLVERHRINHTSSALCLAPWFFFFLVTFLAVILGILYNNITGGKIGRAQQSEDRKRVLYISLVPSNMTDGFSRKEFRR